MVVSQDTRDSIKLNSLNEFDVVEKIGFSDDNNSEDADSNELTGEFLRKDTEEDDKNEETYEYSWEGLLGLTEANGETLFKVGYYEDDNATLQVSKVLPEGIDKTEDKEVNVGYKLKINFVDKT